MARYLRIRSVVKTQRTNAVERISAICGLTPDGGHWTLTQEQAVSQIEDGSCAFYIERVGDRRSDVVVAMDLQAHKYLKTVADGEQPDQLLHLPDCHHVMRTHSGLLRRALSGKFREWLGLSHAQSLVSVRTRT